MARKKAPLTYEQRVEQALEIFGQETEARYKIAKRAYDQQDNATREAFDFMVDRIVEISRDEIAVKPVEDKRTLRVKITPDLIRKNALYMATEICKDLALLDIRVENYEFVPNVCTECAVEIKPAKKKKKVAA
jgi:hypothetical protein